MVAYSHHAYRAGLHHTVDGFARWHCSCQCSFIMQQTSRLCLKQHQSTHKHCAAGQVKNDVCLKVTLFGLVLSSVYRACIASAPQFVTLLPTFVYHSPLGWMCKSYAKARLGVIGDCTCCWLQMESSVKCCSMSWTSCQQIQVP